MLVSKVCADEIGISLFFFSGYCESRSEMSKVNTWSSITVREARMVQPSNDERSLQRGATYRAFKLKDKT